MQPRSLCELDCGLALPFRAADDQETTGRELPPPVAGGSSGCMAERQGTIHTQVTASVTKPEAVCSTVTNTFHFVRPAGAAPSGATRVRACVVGTQESGLLASPKFKRMATLTVLLVKLGPLAAFGMLLCGQPRAAQHGRARQRLRAERVLHRAPG